MTPEEYIRTRARLRHALTHAIEQCDKDQHLNAAQATAEAQQQALSCLNFFLKGGSLQDVRSAEARTPGTP